VLLLLLGLGCEPDPVLDGDGDGVPDTADCAPAITSVYPGAAEICDAVDNDCDGETDEGFDLDGDGWPGLACASLEAAVDCDDEDPAVHPDAEESCDGVDEDCDGAVDELPDEDGDGATLCTDCDDDDPFTAPGQADGCDGLDNDCDGFVDEDWDADGDGVAGCAGDCDDDDPQNAPHLAEVCDGADNDCDGETDEGFDVDGDGYLSCRGDCDDEDPAVHAGAAEVCDGVDNDCDPSTPEADDLDGDGYTLCTGDCDERSAAALPGGVEVCDGYDNDCNGSTDELPTCHDCVESEGYVACSESVVYEEAEEACAGMGRTLAIVGDSAENDVVARVATAGASWIGYTDRDSEGTWAWADGSTGGYTRWYSGEPNNSGDEDCAGTNFGATGFWNDYRCAELLPFVCE